MKFIIAVFVIFGSFNAYALSEDQFETCVIENTNNIQTHVGLLQILIAEMGMGSIEAQSIIIDGIGTKVQAEDVKTCADAELVLVQIYLDGLKAKKAQAQETAK